MSYLSRAEEFKQKTVILTKQKLGAQQVIGAEMIEHSYVSVDELAHMASGDLVARLTSYVLKQDLPPHEVTDTASVSIETPATWWQHFKQQYAERWYMRALVKRRPVRTVKRTQTATLHARWDNMATYPYSDYVTPLDERFGSPVIIHTLDHHVDRRTTQEG